MNKYMKKLILIPLFIILLIGCAHVISEDYRNRADKDISVPHLFENPEAFKGRTIILGGIIASSRNTQEGTFLEIVEKPLDYRGRPKNTDLSYGRFIVLYEGYIDTAIYSKGRLITVAGRVIGKKLQPLGETVYNYLFLKSLELHLLKDNGGLPISIGIGVGATF